METYISASHADPHLKSVEKKKIEKKISMCLVRLSWIILDTYLKMRCLLPWQPDFKEHLYIYPSLEVYIYLIKTYYLFLVKTLSYKLFLPSTPLCPSHKRFDHAASRSRCLMSRVSCICVYCYMWSFLLFCSNLHLWRQLFLLVAGMLTPSPRPLDRVLHLCLLCLLHLELMFWNNHCLVAGMVFISLVTIFYRAVALFIHSLLSVLVTDGAA